MVSYNAEYSLVVIGGGLWVELDYDPSLRFWLDYPLSLGEWEDIWLVWVKLELSGLITIVDDVEQTVGSVLNLYLSEMDRSIR